MRRPDGIVICEDDRSAQEGGFDNGDAYQKTIIGSKQHRVSRHAPASTQRLRGSLAVLRWPSIQVVCTVDADGAPDEPHGSERGGHHWMKEGEAAEEAKGRRRARGVALADGQCLEVTRAAA